MSSKGALDCLVWEKSNLTAGSTNTFTFADAQAACAASTVAGKNWHTATPWVVSQISTKPQDAWTINYADGLTSHGALQSGAYYAR